MSKYGDWLAVLRDPRYHPLKSEAFAELADDLERLMAVEDAARAELKPVADPIKEMHFPKTLAALKACE